MQPKSAEWAGGRRAVIRRVDGGQGGPWQRGAARRTSLAANLKSLPCQMPTTFNNPMHQPRATG